MISKEEEDAYLPEYALKGKPLSGKGCGYHNSVVRLAESLKTKQIVVVKYYEEQKLAEYNKISQTLIDNEVLLLTKLKHPNIVQYIDHGKATLTFTTSPSVNVYFLVLEYLSGGALFDICSVPLSEPLICFIIYEILRTVEFINAMGYAHLDIKLENIMIDGNGVIKFIDFGFTKQLQGEQCDGKQRTFVGTKSYMSPEIYKKEPFLGVVADAFALGVVFFALIGKCFPFEAAMPIDPAYKHIASGNYAEFWKSFISSGASQFSIELQQLLVGIFAPTQISRLTVPEILAHKWMENRHKITETEARTAIKAALASVQHA